MRFPYHDKAWADVEKLLQEEKPKGVLAPDDFFEIYDDIYRYEATHSQELPELRMLILHKGQLDRLDIKTTRKLMSGMRAVLANEVFVVFMKDKTVIKIPNSDPHLAALAGCLKAARKVAKPAPEKPIQLRPDIAFSKLDVEGVRERMNDRYRMTHNDEWGAYEHDCHWDKERYKLVDQMYKEMMGDLTGKDVLEVECGIGRSVPYAGKGQSYLGTDLSDIAVERAKTYHPNFEFKRMDAMDLQIEDEQYDVILGCEITEHVQDQEQFLKECHRVLRPGGMLYVNSANNDSLHLRLCRAMGLPDFKGTYEHFKEYGYDEYKQLLGTCGFQVVDAQGIFLHPYRGLPGIEERVAEQIYEDPDFVEILKELGRRAGPEFGFEYMVAAIKT